VTKIKGEFMKRIPINHSNSLYTTLLDVDRETIVPASNETIGTINQGPQED